MTNRIGIVTLIVAAGCAGNGSPSAVPLPINGLCGVERNTCKAGDPVNTGGTSPPYQWSCAGQYGGGFDSCSVQHAATAEGEVFAGKNGLEERLKAAGPLRGLLQIWDYTLHHPNCDPLYCHYHAMKRAATDMGIPEANIYMRSEDHIDPGILERTRVSAHPDSVMYSHRRDETWEEAQGWWEPGLHVAAAGNVDEEVDRDLWYPDHPHWNSNKLWANWDAAFASFATGRVIMAKYVVRLPTGAIEPLEENVKCGHAGEYCYSIIHDPFNSVAGTSNTGTSSASVRLASLAFYLAQLWDTPREIIGVLNVCAEDVGEPGIDEEYGRGIVAVVCDTVQQRERSTAGESVQTTNVASPVLNRMLQPQSMQPQVPAFGRFRPFYALRGFNPSTMTGHAGTSVNVQGTRLFVSGGADYRPFGIRSSMLHDVRAPFGEIGARRPVFARGSHGADAVGSYGYSRGSNLFLSVARVGGRYVYRPAVDAALSVFTGYRLAYGSLGIPGYRFAGARPVSFLETLPESRIDFAMEW